MKIKFTLNTIIACCAAVLGLVAVLLMFAPSATYEVLKQTESYSGTQMTFGYSQETLLGDAEVLRFSFMNFLTYLLAIAGIVFAVLAIFGKLGKIAPIVACACFLLAGIFFFLAIPFCVPATDNADLAKAAKDNLSLGAGAIVSGILSLISALGCCYLTLKALNILK